VYDLPISHLLRDGKSALSSETQWKNQFGIAVTGYS
jgi:hypothetical protein